jgi:hypothetical protein
LRVPYSFEPNDLGIFTRNCLTGPNFRQCSSTKLGHVAGHSGVWLTTNDEMNRDAGPRAPSEADI